MPASISRRNTPSLSLAGPIVATIFVRLEGRAMRNRRLHAFCGFWKGIAAMGRGPVGLLFTNQKGYPMDNELPSNISACLPIYPQSPNKVLSRSQ
jgi:hypothetical protein